jgi:hypothetical protein
MLNVTVYVNVIVVSFGWRAIYIRIDTKCYCDVCECLVEGNIDRK